MYREITVSGHTFEVSTLSESERTPQEVHLMRTDEHHLDELNTIMTPMEARALAAVLTAIADYADGTNGYDDA